MSKLALIGLLLAPALAGAQQQGGTQNAGGVAQACALDIQKYCPEAGRKELPACMEQYKAKFSASCKAALPKTEAAGQGGLQTACAAEIKRYCAASTPRQSASCLESYAAKLSSGCASAVKAGAKKRDGALEEASSGSSDTPGPSARQTRRGGERGAASSDNTDKRTGLAADDGSGERLRPQNDARATSRRQRQSEEQAQPEEDNTYIAGPVPGEEGGQSQYDERKQPREDDSGED